MAATTITAYNQLVSGLTSGMFNWQSDSYKLTLHGSAYTPNASNTSFDAIAASELATGSGYTNGGYPIVKTYLGSGTTAKLSFGNILVAALGGTLVAKTAVLSRIGYSGGVSNPLVAYIPLGAAGGTVSIADGQGISINFNSQSGAFLLSAP